MPLHLSGVKRWGTGVGCAACGCVLVCFACGPVWWGDKGVVLCVELHGRCVRACCEGGILGGLGGEAHLVHLLLGFRNCQQGADIAEQPQAGALLQCSESLIGGLSMAYWACSEAVSKLVSVRKPSSSIW